MVTKIFVSISRNFKEIYKSERKYKRSILSFKISNYPESQKRKRKRKRKGRATISSRCNPSDIDRNLQVNWSVFGSL
jgi:protoporphyrinogen oxidase